MKIVRVDFSADIGFGHLKRVLLFMQKYRTDDFVLASKAWVDGVVKQPIYPLKDEEEFFRLVESLQPDEVVVDNYGFSDEDEKAFKKRFEGIKLTCFDDLFLPHYCDEVVNHNLYAKKERYDYLPSFTKVRIIRPLIGKNFERAKRKQVKKEGIFMSFGATDAKGVGLKVLKLLKPLKPLVHFYTTSANTHLKDLQKFAFLHRWVRLHIDEDVAQGMARAKFGIITPSVISYEALYMGLSFVAVEVAGNQKYISKYLQKKRINVFTQKSLWKIYSTLFNK